MPLVAKLRTTYAVECDDCGKQACRDYGFPAERIAAGFALEECDFVHRGSWWYCPECAKKPENQHEGGA